MAKVAVIGGGVSGLSCAYYLKSLGHSKIKNIVLLEKTGRLGGWIGSTCFNDGAVFEHGPKILGIGRKAGYNALLLAEELDLTSKILRITKYNAVAKSNLILCNNELYTLPKMSLFSLFKRYPPMTQPLYKCALKELGIDVRDIEDESVFEFCNRRMGSEITNFVFDPLCRAMAAGDAKELSMRSLFPILFDAEKNYGSVIRGLLKDRSRPPVSEFMYSHLVRRAYTEEWRMWTLKTGLNDLIKSIYIYLKLHSGIEIYGKANCTKISPKGDKIEVIVNGQCIEVDHVFSSIPSNSLAQLIDFNETLRNTLLEIPFVDIVVVYLEFKELVLKKTGFGFIAPSFEDSKILGVFFDSCCFPEMNGNSNTRLTCIIGGKCFNNVFGSNEPIDDAALKIALEAVSKHLYINDKPIRYCVKICKQSIPQYIVGHHTTLTKINTELEKHKCLSVLGASYNGFSIPDCIYNARLEVEKFLKILSST